MCIILSFILTLLVLVHFGEIFVMLHCLKCKISSLKHLAFCFGKHLQNDLSSGSSHTFCLKELQECKERQKVLHFPFCEPESGLMVNMKDFSFICLILLPSQNSFKVRISLICSFIPVLLICSFEASSVFSPCVQSSNN